MIQRPELQKLETVIKNKISPIQAHRPRYPHEKGINPAYENIMKNNCVPLIKGVSKIFVLTEKFDLIVGVKNINNDNDLVKSLKEGAHMYINKLDRYGHPSLALKEKVYISGYITQKKETLMVYILSGRYGRCSKSIDTIGNLGLYLYLSYCFQQNYKNHLVNIIQPRDINEIQPLFNHMWGHPKSINIFPMLVELEATSVKQYIKLINQCDTKHTEILIKVFFTQGVVKRNPLSYLIGMAQQIKTPSS